MASLSHRGSGEQGGNGTDVGIGLGALSSGLRALREKWETDRLKAHLAHSEALLGEAHSDITIGPLGTLWL